MTQWFNINDIKIGDWEPKTLWEKLVVGGIGVIGAIIGLGVALFAVFGIAMPVVGVVLAVVAGVIGLVLFLTLGAVLLPVALVLAPIGLIIWGIIALLT